MCINEIGLSGTPDFSPLEQLVANQLWEECEDAHELDGNMMDVAAADVWSVGATLYYAATGLPCPLH